MVNSVLLYGFKFNHITFKKNLDNISNEESLQTPVEKGNSINWLAGHIVVSRDMLLKKLGMEPVYNDPKGEIYARGSSDFTGENAEPISNIELLFYQSQEKLLNVIKNLNLESKDELLKSINGFLLHESYHIGQIGILRRFLGKEGAIK